MLNYRVTLQEKTSREHVTRICEVAIDDAGHPVQNNMRAIRAAIAETQIVIGGDVEWSPLLVEDI
jgi:hypothetical protein